MESENALKRNGVNQNMKRKKNRKSRVIAAFLMLLLLCAAGAVTAQASTPVKKADAAVDIRSKKTGWVKIKGNYYFYNAKGRLQSGSIQYKGNYYYSQPDGKRVTGWVKANNRKYYYDKKTGAMYRSRWADIGGKRYYFNKSGIALTSKWLNYSGNRYYFLEDSTMATGWQKIGKYQYYFGKKGVLAKNKWVGYYYVDAKGRRTDKVRGIEKKNQEETYYTYKSPTLNITLQKSSAHGVSYWVARVRTSSASQVRSALSYGTYGGTRQTTSSAVSSNGGVIGINGSAFDYASGKPSPLGMCIKNGVIYGNYMTSYSVMAVKEDGTMYTPKQGLMGKALLKEGVKDTYNFGPVLIADGKAQPSWAETAKYYPRSAVGMVKPNEYILLVTDTGNYNGLNHWDMVSIFQSFGCQYAYNLDGGGSATLYFNGRVMNQPAGGGERPCADFLYFTR